MRQFLIAVLVCLLAVLAGPGAGHAADAGQVFAEGKKLFDDGQYEAALSKFREALGLSGSPNARLYVARCLQGLGRLPEAYDEMQHAMREAAEKAPSDSKYVSTRDAAAAQIAIMEPKIGKLIVALVGAGETANVALDGQPLPSDRIGVPIPVEPMAHSLVATEVGKKNAEKRVEVRPGQTVTITLELQAEGGGAAPTSTATTGGTSGPVGPLPPEEPSQMTPLRIVGVIATVIGVGGGVTFGVCGGMVLGKRNTLDDECPDGACPNLNYQTTVEDGKRLQIIADVGLGVGAAGLVAGVLLLALGGPSDDEDESPAGDATVGIGPGGGFVGYTVHF